MVAKGWIEEQKPADGGARYLITPAGETALKAKIRLQDVAKPSLVGGFAL
jgi:hypothetical protein